MSVQTGRPQYSTTVGYFGGSFTHSMFWIGRSFRKARNVAASVSRYRGLASAKIGPSWLDDYRQKPSPELRSIEGGKKDHQRQTIGGGGVVRKSPGFGRRPRTPAAIFQMRIWDVVEPLPPKTSPAEAAAPFEGGRQGAVDGAGGGISDRRCCGAGTGSRRRRMPRPPRRGAASHSRTWRDHP